MSNQHIGSTLTSFLEEQGVCAEVELRAKKKILADEVAEDLAGGDEEIHSPVGDSAEHLGLQQVSQGRRS